MKFIIQAITAVVMIVGFIITMNEKSLGLEIFQTPLTYANIALFTIILPPFSLIMFGFLAAKERKDKRVCLAVAGSVCLVIFLLSCCMGFMSWDWIAVQSTGSFNAVKNTVWKAIDFFVGIVLIAVLASYCLIYLGTFPFVKITPKKPVGGHARELVKRHPEKYHGIDIDILDELLEDSYRKQREESSK